MQIKKLRNEVSSAIAAGEVLERPASAIKELVENSVDSNASIIEVEIIQGGLESIRVRDNGIGIPAKDLSLALTRHATSKLFEISDLNSLKTLGFRGEALASIAAASRVNLSSRVRGDEGYFVEVLSGQILKQGSIGMSPGTSVSVEALFSTTPARLKYMKSSAVEAARIKQVVEGLALSNTSIGFSLKSDGKSILHTQGGSTLFNSFTTIYGSENASMMVQFESYSGLPYRANGIVSLPKYHRRDRKGIKVFVNGRVVNNRFLNVCVTEAYRGLLMEGRFPICVINLEVPSEELDVNVHPNKLEVRFLKESDAFISIQKPLRKLLLEQSSSNPSELMPERLGGVSFTTPNLSFNFSVTPNQKNPAINEVIDQPLGNLKALGQIGSTYIVAEAPDGLIIVDQHAAHESIIFYELIGKWSSVGSASQPLLDPLIIETNQDQMETAINSKELLKSYGFDIEPFDETSVVLREIPKTLKLDRAAESLIALLSHPNINKSNEITDAEWGVAASIACHSAIRGGQSLTHFEMQQLLHALEFRTDPDHCPHGRPTIIKIDSKTLEKEFGRAT